MWRSAVVVGRRTPGQRRIRAAAAALVLAACGSALAATSAAASDFTWSGAAPVGTSNWSDATNWGGGAPSGAVGTLTFPPLASAACTSSQATGTCYTSKNDISGLSANHLSVTGTGGQGYSITGDGITLGAGGITATTATAQGGSAALSLPIALGATQTWTLSGSANAGGLNLFVDGDLSGSGANLTADLSDGGGLGLFGNDEVGNVAIDGASAANNFTNGYVVLGGSLNATDSKTVTATHVDLGADSEPPGAQVSVGALTTVDSFVSVHAPLSAVGAAFDSASTVQFAISGSGTTAGTDYGQLTSSGTVALGGATLSIASTSINGPPPCQYPVGRVYTLISTTGTLTGAFANAANGGIVADAANNGIPGCAQPVFYRIGYNEIGPTKTVTATVLPTLAWSGGAASGQANWSSGSNWASGVAPASSSDVGVLDFPTLSSGACTATPPTDTCYTSHNDVAGLSADQLLMTNGYSISGTGITLGSGGLALADMLAGAVPGVIDAPIALAATQTWNLAGNLDVGGGLSGSAADLTVNTNPLLQGGGGGGHLRLTGSNEVGNVTVEGFGEPQFGPDGGLDLGDGSIATTLDTTDGHSLTLTGDGFLSARGPVSVGAYMSIGSATSIGGDVVPTGSLSVASAAFDAQSAVDFAIPPARAPPRAPTTASSSPRARSTSPGPASRSSRATRSPVRRPRAARCTRSSPPPGR